MTDRNPLAASLQLLWEGLPQSEKGPKPKLSLEQIVDAAIGLADREGMKALSMRRLAQELEVGTMSLYRYVPSKQELLDLMLDAVATPTAARTSVRSKGWRTFLVATAQEGRQLYLDHPWALHANTSRQVLGPNGVADMELFMSGIKELPLSDREKINLVSAIDSFVVGTVRQELQWQATATESSMTDEEFWEHQLPVLERAMESGRYPTMATMDEDTFDGTWEENFEFGVALILDGIESLIKRRGA